MGKELDCVPPEILTLRPVHPHSSGFPILALALMKVKQLLCFCSAKLWFSVFACWLQWFWRQLFVLWSHFSYRSKESCWFFSLFSFLLVIKEWWFLSSLHAELETGSYVLLFYYLISINAVWHSGKKSTYQFSRARDFRFSPWAGKIPWRREWQSTPVFLPGESPWTEESGGLQSVGSQSQIQLRAWTCKQCDG